MRVLMAKFKSWFRSGLWCGPGLPWSQWVYPGPTRVFTPAELARAGTAPWPRGIDMVVVLNALVVWSVYANMPGGVPAWSWPAVLLVLVLGLMAARQLWARPHRRLLNTQVWAHWALIIGVLVVTAQWWGKEALKSQESVLLALLLTEVIVQTAWWGLTLYRSHQIAARLVELDGQDERVRLAARLATAQIQPHFIFNTLASLQHWVDVRDERASALLRDFTQYLRGALPAFSQEALPLAQELVLVRHYLRIMQARLGARLRWHEEIALPQALLEGTRLPPGAWLTLVENAIGHGVEPALQGGEVWLRMSLLPAQAGQGARLCVSVHNSGEPLRPDTMPGPDSQGLRNTRERLQALYGSAAALGLQKDESGHTWAWMTLPLAPEWFELSPPAQA
ncbi:sensor histidine kinase [Roseateles sp. BYS180W]|uniref:Sensor histidine kinase n=1 Tax=Roseateles rivi TaxID=3299028 RepID=A0ABW7FTC9_9BURK